VLHNLHTNVSDPNSVRVGWNDRTFRLLEKHRRPAVYHAASDAELASYTTQARSELGGLVSDDVLKRVQAHNPDVFQIISYLDAPSEPIGFNAAMPLNEAGYIALTENRFDQSNPSLEYIARRGEPVVAIYVWLIFTPKSFIACAKALSSLALTMAPSGCALFCRGATPKTYDFMVGVGYEEANKIYPLAPNGLLVMHPVRELASTEKVAERVEVARTLADIMQVVAIRAATYISDQECPYEEEFDGNDFCSAHLIGYVGNEPAGCIRIRFFSSFVKFERLAVRREFRSSKLAFRLVREAMRYAGRKGFDQVYGHARFDLVRFWQSFGFRPLEGGQEFVFSDVAYVEMSGPIKGGLNALTIGDHPLVLIRPEGAWDAPGPLERTTDIARSQRVTNQLRHGV
jgi:predicted GNAT family N-acyltransferase